MTERSPDRLKRAREEYKLVSESLNPLALLHSPSHSYHSRERMITRLSLEFFKIANPQSHTPPTVPSLIIFPLIIPEGSREERLKGRERGREGPLRRYFFLGLLSLVS
jgi:hypothetical protein